MAAFLPLPDAARVWILGAERSLDSDEEGALLNEIHAFLGSWRSHGRTVEAQALVAEGRFLVIAAHIHDGANAGVSGCGIDALMAAADAAAEHVGFAWADGLQVFYRDASGSVRALSRTAFREEVRIGRVGADTTVFDTTISELGMLRVFGMERRAGESWHARVFRLPGRAATA